MLNFKKITGLAAAALFASAMSVSALPIFNLVSADPGAITSTGGTGTGESNNGVSTIYSPATSQNGFFGGTLSLTGAALPTQIQITYLGSEAGNVNRFFWNGEVIFTTAGNTNAFNINGPSAVRSGNNPLNFGFSTDSLTEQTSNGSGPGGTGLRSIFYTLLDSRTVDLWFDDGNRVDDNHDDMAIRLSVVPLPAAAWLLLAGLGGMGLVARRRKAA